MESKDKLGKTFKVGQFVVKAYGTGCLAILRVTKITDQGIYLGQSHHPLIYPGCVIILDELNLEDFN